MELLWRSGALAVRDVVKQLGATLAYTTIMTTLDRLYKKGLLAREKDGNAYLYRASLTRDDFHRRVAEQTVASLLAKSHDPVLAGFVDAAVTSDARNLARLERLIAERRRGKK